MYNADKPSYSDLPTSKQLIRSTIIAIISAAVILITIVLPAEYAIDPTGIGRFLGLAEMGTIKTQLAKEADQDRQKPGAARPAPDKRSSLVERIFGVLLVRSAAAEMSSAGRSDKMSITLKPTEGKEIKLRMRRGAKANFSWSVSGGVVNFDLHGDGGGRSKSYKKGRGVRGAKGTLIAAFNGNHGWFWRNRGRKTVTVTLQTSGDYTSIKEMR